MTENKFNSIHELLPPFGKIVELECNGNVFKGSLFEIKANEFERYENGFLKGIATWIVHDSKDSGLRFSTATNWRFINT